MIAPNMAMPMVKPIALATLNTRDRNRGRGMIGSAARVSHQMKAEPSAAPRAASPRIVDDVHAYSLPPQVATIVRAATPALSSTAPITSMRWRIGGVWRCSRQSTIATASTPIGMLT